MDFALSRRHLAWRCNVIGVLLLLDRNDEAKLHSRGMGEGVYFCVDVVSWSVSMS